jgi:hypothetical protein
MACCIGQTGVYSGEIQLTTTSPTRGVDPTKIEAGQYYLLVHAPTWAPDILIKAAAALKDALTGQFGQAWTIAFGSYYVQDNLKSGALGSVMGSQTVGTAPDLTQPHKTLVYPFTLSSKTGATAQYGQLEVIAGIISAIAGVLIVFGILWIIVEINKVISTVPWGPLFYILLAIGGVMLLSKPGTQKQIKKAAGKGVAAAKGAVKRVTE